MEKRERGGGTATPLVVTEWSERSRSANPRASEAPALGRLVGPPHRETAALAPRSRAVPEAPAHAPLALHHPGSTRPRTARSRRRSRWSPLVPRAASPTRLQQYASFRSCPPCHIDWSVACALARVPARAQVESRNQGATAMCWVSRLQNPAFIVERPRGCVIPPSMRLPVSDRALCLPGGPPCKSAFETPERPTPDLRVREEIHPLALVMAPAPRQRVVS